MIKKILAAVLTSLVIATFAGLTSYLPSPEDVYPLSFQDEFVYTLVYLTPVLLAILVPVSIVVDLLHWVYSKYFVSKINPYIFKLISYSLIGLLSSFIPGIAISYVLFALVLFFHILILISKMGRKNGQVHIKPTP